ncbi:MAG: hypothetical protein OEO82_06375 [Gammaproteobacteria bacterium]|nr:hypothetical protein [Gammaproteobacteria bacterium]
MRRVAGPWIGTARIAMLCTAMMLSACASRQPAPEPVAAEPELIAELPPPILKDKPAAIIPAVTRLPPVAIVMTSNQPAYADVAQELANRFPDYELYDLSDRSRPPVSVLRSINDSDSFAVLAVGLRAAQSSVAMAEMPVVFCQVFNHQDHDLLHENSRGVASIAPLDAQLATWKKLDPGISRIGVIIGEGHAELVAQAEAAALQYSVELDVRIARTDQETLYHFRRMIRNINGFWLFPDNRILSARVLQEMLDEAKAQHVPVAVPNEAMLTMGAAISMTTVAADIAETMVNVIRRIQAGQLSDVPPISRLSEIHVETNDEIRVVVR